MKVVQNDAYLLMGKHVFSFYNPTVFWEEEAFFRYVRETFPACRTAKHLRLKTIWGPIMGLYNWNSRLLMDEELQIIRVKVAV